MNLGQIIIDRLEKIDARVRSIEVSLTNRLTSVESKIDQLDNHAAEIRELDGRIETLEEARAERRGAVAEAVKAKKSAWGAMAAALTSVVYQIFDWLALR